MERSGAAGEQKQSGGERNSDLDHCRKLLSGHRGLLMKLYPETGEKGKQASMQSKILRQ